MNNLSNKINSKYDTHENFSFALEKVESRLTNSNWSYLCVETDGTNENIVVVGFWTKITQVVGSWFGEEDMTSQSKIDNAFSKILENNKSYMGDKDIKRVINIAKSVHLIKLDEKEKTIKTVASDIHGVADFLTKPTTQQKSPEIPLAFTHNATHFTPVTPEQQNVLEDPNVSLIATSIPQERINEHIMHVAEASLQLNEIETSDTNEQEISLTPSQTVDDEIDIDSELIHDLELDAPESDLPKSLDSTSQPEVAKIVTKENLEKSQIEEKPSPQQEISKEEAPKETQILEQEGITLKSILWGGIAIGVSLVASRYLFPALEPLRDLDNPLSSQPNSHHFTPGTTLTDTPRPTFWEEFKEDHRFYQIQSYGDTIAEQMENVQEVIDAFSESKTIHLPIGGTNVEESISIGIKSIIDSNQNISPNFDSDISSDQFVKIISNNPEIAASLFNPKAEKLISVADLTAIKHSISLSLKNQSVSPIKIRDMLTAIIASYKDKPKKDWDLNDFDFVDPEIEKKLKENPFAMSNAILVNNMRLEINNKIVATRKNESPKSYKLIIDEKKRMQILSEIANDVDSYLTDEEKLNEDFKALKQANRNFDMQVQQDCYTLQTTLDPQEFEKGFSSLIEASKSGFTKWQLIRNLDYTIPEIFAELKKQPSNPDLPSKNYPLYKLSKLVIQNGGPSTTFATIYDLIYDPKFIQIKDKNERLIRLGIEKNIPAGFSKPEILTLSSLPVTFNTESLKSEQFINNVVRNLFNPNYKDTRSLNRKILEDIISNGDVSKLKQSLENYYKDPQAYKTPENDQLLSALNHLIAEKEM